MLSPLAVRAVALIVPWCMAGPTAAGITEFLWRRAEFPVTGAVQVLLTTSTGVQGGGFSLVDGVTSIIVCRLYIFWHLFTNRTVAVL
jgi:hypothetical protein